MGEHNESSTRVKTKHTYPYKFRPEKPPLVPANCDSSLLPAILSGFVFFEGDSPNSRTDLNHIPDLFPEKMAE